MSADKDKKIKILLVLFVFITLAVGLMAYFAESKIPEYIGRELTDEEEKKIIAENSDLISYVKLSPHADFPRKGEIRKITIHHMAGNNSLERIGKEFSFKDRAASANYGIDSNGNVGLYVEESNRSWASRNEENDQMAVTIEVADDEMGGEWHVSDKAFHTLIELCVDICRRNNIEKLVFTGDPEGNLTYHRMFTSETECPGPYLISRMKDIEKLVNEQLDQ